MNGSNVPQKIYYVERSTLENVNYSDILTTKIPSGEIIKLKKTKLGSNA